MLFPDVSEELHKQRRRFDGVKCKLRELDIQYGIVFPARLRITYGGRSHFFDNPSETEIFITKIQKKGDCEKTEHAMCSRMLNCEILKKRKLKLMYHPGLPYPSSSWLVRWLVHSFVWMWFVSRTWKLTKMRHTPRCRGRGGSPWVFFSLWVELLGGQHQVTLP